MTESTRPIPHTADINMSARGMLSAQDLLQMVKPVDSGLPSRAGIKDYAPDGSWLEAKRVQTYHDDQLRLLSEERVKKLGSLARGEWLPDSRKVLLTKEVGKFWSHFGHMEDGRKMLHPEEAMYLLDEGQMEVYYGGMPLSLQEAYATLLGHGVPLEHYQVFAHLARLGYTLRRHEPSPMLTEYERKIHLDIHQKKTTKRQRKRPKNALSEQSSCTKDDAEKEDDSIVKKIKTEDRLSESCAMQNDTQCMETRMDNCQHSGAAERLDRQTSDVSSGATRCETLTSNVAVPTYENTAGMYLTNCISGNVVNIAQSSSVSSIHKVPYSNWDFDATLFPDFCCGKSTFELRLPAPELLPDDIGCNGAQIASRGVREMSKQQVNAPEHPLKCRSNNWGEYKKGLTRLSPDDTLLLCTHAPSLWNGAVTPLVKPHQATSTDAILEKLKVTPNIDVTKIEATKHCDGTVLSTAEIIYDVFLPDSKFKKSNPGKPDHRIFVARQEDRPPSLSEVQQLGRQGCDGVPLNWAVVDNGDIAFYSFNLVDLPRGTSFL